MPRFHHDHHRPEAGGAAASQGRAYGLCWLHVLTVMQMANGCRRIHCCEHFFHKTLTPVTKVYAHLTTYSDSAMTPRRSHDSAILPHKK